MISHKSCQCHFAVFPNSSLHNDAVNYFRLISNSMTAPSLLILINSQWFRSLARVIVACFILEYTFYTKTNLCFCRYWQITVEFNLSRIYYCIKISLWRRLAVRVCVQMELIWCVFVCIRITQKILMRTIFISRLQNFPAGNRWKIDHLYFHTLLSCF